MRSFFGLAGVVLFWKGLWDYIENTVESLQYPTMHMVIINMCLATAGITVLIYMNTFFANVGVAPFGLSGSEPPLQQQVQQSRVQQDSATSLFVKSLVSLSAVVTVWAGIYDTIDLRIASPSLTFDSMCTVLGVLMLQMTGALGSVAGVADADDAGAAGQTKGKSDPDFSAQYRTSPSPSAASYVLGVVAIVGAVTFWKGFSNILNQHTLTPSIRREVGYAVVGVMLFLATDTLSFNSGVDDEDDGDGDDRRHDSAAQHRAYNDGDDDDNESSRGSTGAFGRDAYSSSPRVQEKGCEGAAPPSSSSSGAFSYSQPLPASTSASAHAYYVDDADSAHRGGGGGGGLGLGPWLARVRAVLALAATVTFWSGVENLLDHTAAGPLREPAISGAGLLLLALTGSLRSNAGLPAAAARRASGGGGRGGGAGVSHYAHAHFLPASSSAAGAQGPGLGGAGLGGSGGGGGGGGAGGCGGGIDAEESFALLHPQAAARDEDGNVILEIEQLQRAPNSVRSRK